jgi:hypothetical protein
MKRKLRYMVSCLYVTEHSSGSANIIITRNDKIGSATQVKKLGEGIASFLYNYHDLDCIPHVTITNIQKYPI